MKTCIRCHEEKPLNEYGPYKRSKDGRTAACRACINERQKELRNKEAEKARYHANKERHKKKRREHAKQNAEKIRARVKDWRESNPEKLKELKKRYVKGRVERCADGYVRGLLTKGSSLSTAAIPDVLVECKRLELKISRYVKETT